MLNLLILLQVKDWKPCEIYQSIKIKPYKHGRCLKLLKIEKYRFLMIKPVYQSENLWYHRNMPDEGKNYIHNTQPSIFMVFLTNRVCFKYKHRMYCKSTVECMLFAFTAQYNVKIQFNACYYGITLQFV